MHFPLKIKVVTTTGVISLVIGIVVIVGWIFNIISFQTIIPKYASMKFNTSLGFILLGGLLIITQVRLSRVYIVTYWFLSIVVIAIGFISLLQTIFNFSLGLDELFVNDDVSAIDHLTHPGRMSVNTATCFVFLGFAFVGFAFNIKVVHIVAQYFLNLVTAVSSVALIGYLYGLSLFYNLSYSGSMAVHTALLFFFISITTSLLHPSIGITSLFTGKRVGNIMARRVFFTLIFVVVIFGALRVESQQLRLFSFSTGVAVLIICFLCVGMALVWHMVTWLNKLDKSRHEAEQEVKVMNHELEKRVKERSAKLVTMLVKFRESESKFKAAFEHSAIGMALVSIKGKWLQVNKTLCDMVGYKERELLSMSFVDIAHPDDRAIYKDLPQQILTTENHTGRIEKRYVCKDGAVVWISVNIATVTNKKGGPVYFVSQFEDITDRKKAEANLKTAYSEIKTHVNSIKDIAWKQSHLIRSPLANLKGLTTLLVQNPADNEILSYIQIELERLDNAIIEMAEDAAGCGVKQIAAKKRTFR